MKYSMNLMTANPFSPSPGTTATAQFQKQPLLQTSLSSVLIIQCSFRRAESPVRGRQDAYPYHATHFCFLGHSCIRLPSFCHNMTIVQTPRSNMPGGAAALPYRYLHRFSLGIGISH